MGLFDIFKKKDNKQENTKKADLIVQPSTNEEEKPVTQSTAKKDEKPKKHFEEIKVHGCSFYPENFRELDWVENDDYRLKKSEMVDDYLINEKVFKEEFVGNGVTELIDEPENPEDPKAIAVYVDKLKIGYIPKGKTAHIRKLRKEDNIREVTVDIKGGKYKIVYENEDDDTYDLVSGDLPYFAKITIYYKTPK